MQRSPISYPSIDLGWWDRRTARVGKFEGYFLFMWRVWERGKIHSADSTGRIEPYELPATVLPAKIVNFRILPEPGLRSRPFWSGSIGHREAIRLKRQNWTFFIPADSNVSAFSVSLLRNCYICRDAVYLRGSPRLIINLIDYSMIIRITLMYTGNLIGKFWARAIGIVSQLFIGIGPFIAMNARWIMKEEWKTSVFRWYRCHCLFDETALLKKSSLANWSLKSSKGRGDFRGTCRDAACPVGYQGNSTDRRPFKYLAAISNFAFSIPTILHSWFAEVAVRLKAIFDRSRGIFLIIGCCNRCREGFNHSHHSVQ